MRSCIQQLVVLLGFFLVPAVFAQTSGAGRISGTLTDATGAFIPAVDVTVTNQETQIARTVRADDNGFYVATNLQPGLYSVRAEKTGFKRAEKRASRWQAMVA